MISSRKSGRQTLSPGDWRRTSRQLNDWRRFLCHQLHHTFMLLLLLLGSALSWWTIFQQNLNVFIPCISKRIKHLSQMLCANSLHWKWMTVGPLSAGNTVMAECIVLHFWPDGAVEKGHVL